MKNKLKLVRLVILTILSICTVSLYKWSLTYDVDPNYGRMPVLLFTSLPVLGIWVPYWIITMFIDKNKTLGVAAISIVLIDFAALIYLFIGKVGLADGFVVFLMLTLSLPALLLLEVINIVTRKKT